MPRPEPTGYLGPSPSPRPGLRPGLFYWHALSVGAKGCQDARDGVDIATQGLGLGDGDHRLSEHGRGLKPAVPPKLWQLAALHPIPADRSASAERDGPAAAGAMGSTRRASHRANLSLDDLENSAEPGSVPASALITWWVHGRPLAASTATGRTGESRLVNSAPASSGQRITELPASAPLISVNLISVPRIAMPRSAIRGIAVPLTSMPLTSVPLT